jgi:hypothetical protein
VPVENVRRGVGVCIRTDTQGRIRRERRRGLVILIADKHEDHSIALLDRVGTDTQLADERVIGDATIVRSARRHYQIIIVR